MTKRFRKILSILCALAMLLACLPAGFADEPEPDMPPAEGTQQEVPGAEIPAETPEEPESTEGEEITPPAEDPAPETPAQEADPVPEEPAVEPEQPAEEPVQPAEEPEQPAGEPVQPEEEPIQPAEEPTQPAEEPTQPSEEPVQPAEEPTQPAEEPTQPAEEPAQPAEEPAQPAEEPAQPAEEPTQPVEEQVQPAEEPEQPAEESKDEEPESKPAEPEKKELKINDEEGLDIVLKAGETLLVDLKGCRTETVRLIINCNKDLIEATDETETIEFKKDETQEANYIAEIETTESTPCQIKITAKADVQFNLKANTKEEPVTIPEEIIPEPEEPAEEPAVEPSAPVEEPEGEVLEEQAVEPEQPAESAPEEEPEDQQKPQEEKQEEEKGKTEEQPREVVSESAQVEIEKKDLILNDENGLDISLKENGVVLVILKGEKEETVRLAIDCSNDSIATTINTKEVQFISDDGENIIEIVTAENHKYLIEIIAKEDIEFNLKAISKITEEQEEDLGTEEQAEDVMVDGNTELSEESNPKEEIPEENIPESDAIAERKITVEITWDVNDPVIGDIAHFKAYLEGYDGLDYSLQWQYSPDNETWYDIVGETNETMDVVVTEENNIVYWRILVNISEEQET